MIEQESSGMPREWLERRIIELQRELAQARALLERVADFDSYDDYSIQPLQEEIRAFLAQQHAAQTPLSLRVFAVALKRLDNHI